MAKAKKGGLGRGLNSLLGGESEGAVIRDTAPKEEKETTHQAESAKQEPRVPSPSKPVVKPSAPPIEKKEQEAELYSNKEDNITIKSVVSREVRQEVKRAVTEEKKIKKEKEEDKAEEATNEVSIDLIEPNPTQPRTHFKKEELEELAESIRKNGLLQPILVRKQGEKYEIVAGERRWQACKKIGMKKVPVVVKEVDDDETIILALIENIQRTDLNPIEEAYGYRRMMERGKMTQSQVAQAVSKGRSTIANALRLLELPEEAQQLLFEEEITAGHARAILSVPTKEGRQKLTEKLVKEKLSVRETEAIARLLSPKKEEKKEERPQVPKSYKTVARSLKETLQTDVKVKSIKGKNKIEITFKDEADLERLFRIIASE